MSEDLSPTGTTPAEAAMLLRWWLEAGVTDILDDAPRSWLAAPRGAESAAPVVYAPSPAHAPAPVAPIIHRPDLSAITRLADLEVAVRSYDGCPLRATATNTVFADGVPASRLLVIGETPIADDDRAGRPFTGAPGQLLDKMMSTIGRNRSASPDAAFYATNMLFWRPPGNRPPTPQEIQLCLPFVLRHIELIDPIAIFILGQVPLQGLVNTSEVITRSRGTWRFLELGGKKYPILPSLDPRYLLNQPSQKRLAWSDLLSLKKFLETGAT
jgi:uracil-DNA glycosylase